MQEDISDEPDYIVPEVYKELGTKKVLCLSFEEGERISDWLPWMKMRGRTGIIYFHTSGRKLEDFEQLPDILKDFIDDRYPKYREAPPVDDDRPNETSWTYFKKVLSDQKK